MKFVPVQLSYIAGWTNPGVTGSGGNEQPTPQAFGVPMIEPSLEPRKYRIVQDYNTEYVYFVEWLAGYDKPWAILLGTTGMYLTEKMSFDYDGHDTARFSTADEALTYWKRYVECR